MYIKKITSPSSNASASWEEIEKDAKLGFQFILDMSALNKLPPSVGSSRRMET